MALNIHDETYAYLVKKFSAEKIQSRHDWLTNILLTWIEQHEYSNKVAIMSEQIDHILIDYFVDIDRLKQFTGISKTNAVKIYAYIAYWILRRKPLQVITAEDAEDLVFVNENLVADILLDFIFNDPSGVSIVSSQREKMGLFEDTLRYYLKYRTVTPQVIELMLLAFHAGRGYQYSVDYRQ